MPFLLKPTVTEIFLERVKQTPGVVGFQFKSTNAAVGPVGEWKEVTFREFFDECQDLSLGLEAFGVKPGDKVAILSRTRYEWALADMAILGARAVTVPIYASSTGKDMAYLLDHSGARVLFVEDADQLAKLLAEKPDLDGLDQVIYFEPSTDRLSGRSPKIMPFTAVKKNGENERRAHPNRFEENLRASRPEDLITICYTSGTTGTPKGVMLTHRNVVSVLTDAAKVFSPHIHPERERLLTILPFSHIIGKIESLATYVFGWRECYAESIEKIDDNLREVRPTILFAVPRIFEKAYATIQTKLKELSAPERMTFNLAVKSGERYYSRIWAGRKPGAARSLLYHLSRQSILERVLEGFGGKLRFAICGGAPLPKEVGEYFQILGILVLEGYGLTETAAPVTINTVEHPKFGTVGKPMPEVSVKIADDGEILLKSEKLFAGYYRMEEETRESFEDGWYKTGDVGFIDPQGFLHITDRKKDLIITSGGKNVAPQKIEELAKRTHPLVSEMVVIGDRRKYLTALVTLDPAQLATFAESQNMLYSDLAELTQNVKVQAQVQRIVDEMNRNLARFETLKKFVILPQPFSIETGELTPSLKVKRGTVAKKYRTEIESMYRDS